MYVLWIPIKLSSIYSVLCVVAGSIRVVGCSPARPSVPPPVGAQQDPPDAPALGQRGL
jgi:hypothetical protein